MVGVFLGEGDLRCWEEELWTPNLEVYHYLNDERRGIDVIFGSVKSTDESEPQPANKEEMIEGIFPDWASVDM